LIATVLLITLVGCLNQELNPSYDARSTREKGSYRVEGIGGILYTLRNGVPSYTHYNSRGDVVAKTSSTGAITYQALYEAYGKRTVETGNTLDRQKANTKDEDPTGLVNEGFRYRDLDTGIFITRDPLGFVDGPNMYSYVRDNPWSHFDPEGLQEADPDEEVARKADTPILRPQVPPGGRAAPVNEDDKQEETVRRNMEPSNDTGKLPVPDLRAPTNEEQRSIDEQNKSPDQSSSKTLLQTIRDVVNNITGNQPNPTGDPSPNGETANKPTAKPIDSTRPQHGTESHDATAFNIAKGMQDTPGNTDARFNQQLTNPNGEAIPGFKPDSQVNRTLPNGTQVKDVTEVRSPSQTSQFMDNKVNAMKQALGNQAGTVNWVDPTPGATRNP
jgi:RHS repeat-associated protein